MSTPCLSVYRVGDRAVIADCQVEGLNVEPFKLHYVTPEPAIRLGNQLAEIGRQIIARKPPDGAA